MTMVSSYRVKKWNPIVKLTAVKRTARSYARCVQCTTAGLDGVVRSANQRSVEDFLNPSDFGNTLTCKITNRAGSGSLAGAVRGTDSFTRSWLASDGPLKLTELPTNSFGERRSLALPATTAITHHAAIPSTSTTAQHPRMPKMRSLVAPPTCCGQGYGRPGGVLTEMQNSQKPMFGRSGKSTPLGRSRSRIWQGSSASHKQKSVPWFAKKPGSTLWTEEGAA